MTEERLTQSKAIRAYCLECCCGSSNEVKLCPLQTCPLYPYRFGKNPYLQKRELTEEQKAVLAERLAKARKLKPSKSHKEYVQKIHEGFEREFIPPESQTSENAYKQ